MLYQTMLVNTLLALWCAAEEKWLLACLNLLAAGLLGLSALIGR